MGNECFVGLGVGIVYVEVVLVCFGGEFGVGGWRNEGVEGGLLVFEFVWFVGGVDLVCDYVVVFLYFFFGGSVLGCLKGGGC